MLVQALILLLSIGILYYGAEFALEGAEKIGLALNFSPLVIGLVIVGFGTSLPEFFVSHLASYRGEYGLALGNIVGSNVANLFLILGVSGLMTPLLLGRKDILMQLYWHLALTLLLGLFLSFGALSLTSFLVFEAFFISYLLWTYAQMRKDQRLNPVEKIQGHESITFFVILKLLLGFVLLFAGGELLVTSGTKLGLILGIPAFVISAVFVAFGTSFPELVTALVACLKKKDTDLITGNILGSNVFNVALILGSLGLYKMPLESAYTVEISALLGASVLMLVMAHLSLRHSKIAGGLYLGVYFGVIYYWVS